MRRLLVGLAVAVAAACSGTGSAASTGTATATGTGAGACPSSAPSEGAPCTASQQRCTYSRRSAPECGTLWVCYASTWRLLARGSCQREDRGACPSDATATAPRREQDVTARRSLACVYPPGLVCEYSADPAPCSGVARPPPQLRWTCRSPGPTACALPSLPETCTEEGLTCGSTCCGRSQTCVHGRWQSELHPCPP